MLPIRHYYVFNGKRSRGYLTARGCVRTGARKVKGAKWLRYRVSFNGTAGIRRKYRPARERATDLLRSKPVGSTVRFKAVRGEDEVVGITVFRKATKAPPVPDTEGVLGIDRIVGWVNAEARAGRLKGVRYAGICVCKPNSDHRDCAAVDIFADWDSMEKIEREFWSKPDYYNSKYSILGRTIRYINSAQPYYGDYHAHNHLSVNGGRPGSAC